MLFFTIKALLYLKRSVGSLLTQVRSMIRNMKSRSNKVVQMSRVVAIIAHATHLQISLTSDAFPMCIKANPLPISAGHTHLQYNSKTAWRAKHEASQMICSRGPCAELVGSLVLYPCLECQIYSMRKSAGTEVCRSW